MDEAVCIIFYLIIFRNFFKSKTTYLHTPLSHSHLNNLSKKHNRMYTILRRYKYTQLKSQIVKCLIHVLIVVFFSIQALKAQTYPPGFSQVLVANGISHPTVMAFAPDGRVFVAQQTGALRLIENGVLLSTPFITLTVNSSGERGLLGIAFDPNFNTNHFIYLYYTLSSGTNNRISRFTASGNVVVPNSEVMVLNL